MRKTAYVSKTLDPYTKKWLYEYPDPDEPGKTILSYYNGVSLKGKKVK